jgi:hypothetical protein
MSNDQHYTVTGKPAFTIGDEIEGFDFSEGKELQGKIVEITPYIVFGYVLDTGGVLGPHDDIYTRYQVQP